MSVRWYISHLDKDAAEEVALLLQNEDVKREIARILRLLASQDDPRLPSKQSGLMVEELVDDAPSWFRVKIPRYAIRIVFRLLVVRSKKTLDIGNYPLKETDRGTIDITHAAYRKEAYGEKLRRRYRRMRGEN